MRCRRSSKCAPSAVMRLRRWDVISSQCCGVLALLNIQFLPAWKEDKHMSEIQSFYYNYFRNLRTSASLKNLHYGGLTEMASLVHVSMMGCSRLSNSVISNWVSSNSFWVCCSIARAMAAVTCSYIEKGREKSIRKCYQPFIFNLPLFSFCSPKCKRS